MKFPFSPILEQDGVPTYKFSRESAVHRSPISDRQNRGGQRGEGRLKAILWTLALAIFVYVCFKVTPALINEYQFQDGMETLARFASVNRQTPEVVRAEILKEAQKDDVPVNAEDIKVESVNGNIRVHVDYSVTVDLVVYQWILNFHPAVSNNSLT